MWNRQSLRSQRYYNCLCYSVSEYEPIQFLKQKKRIKYAKKRCDFMQKSAVYNTLITRIISIAIDSQADFKKIVPF